MPPEYFRLRFSGNSRSGNTHQNEQLKVDLYLVIVLRHSESRNIVQAHILLNWIL